MSSTSTCVASLRLVFVDADDDVLAAIDARLALGRRFLDAQFRHAAFDRLGHAAQCFHFGDQLLGGSHQARGQMLST